jgi:uncharacterized SAM-binding protein YcdF (DUF218 family)
MLLVVLLGIAAWWRSRGAAVLALALLLLASTPLLAQGLIRYAEGYAVKQDISTQPQAAAIVVLSGMLNDVQGGSAVVTEWSDPDRFFAGLELYKAGKAPQLIFTGGQMPWSLSTRSEGQQLSEYAQQFGVPPATIQVTGPVQNTAQEAQAVRALLTGALPNIILVTSAFHMARAKLMFERVGFSVQPYPVDFKIRAEQFTPMDLLPSARMLQLTDIALRELMGQIYARFFQG